MDPSGRCRTCCLTPRQNAGPKTGHLNRTADNFEHIETMKRIQVIDSHTGGEPTRIIVEGGPDLGTGSLADRLNRFRDQHDEIRSAVVNEPRGSDVFVGGILCEPTKPEFSAAVVFFNNTGYLGMCGHGTIGLLVTLKHLGRVKDGTHQIETPVGAITATLSGNSVSVQNVASYRYLANVAVEVPDYGTVVGDVAWGGNWFFLVKNSNEELIVSRADELTSVALRIRDALDSAGISGANGSVIDHIELFGPASDVENDSRNFVLCPGGAYDRSPCGTGTSAKLACLAADGKLQPGVTWRQESIVGTVFECTYENCVSKMEDGETADFQAASKETAENTNSIIPTISGSAFVCGESSLILNPSDPFCMGIRS